MAMTEWLRMVSRYQTANWLTPLPATSNWDLLKPLDENGSILQPGKIRPYHLYTGRQLVHYDPRWSMEESHALFQRYASKLQQVDTVYERLFTMFLRRRQQVKALGKEAAGRADQVLGDLADRIKANRTAPTQAH